MTNDAYVLSASNRSVAAVDEFETFVVGSRDRLFGAFAAHHGRQVAEEVLSEVYVYAWAHWVEVHRLSNPVGYLFRMGPHGRATKHSGGKRTRSGRSIRGGLGRRHQPHRSGGDAVETSS